MPAVAIAAALAVVLVLAVVAPVVVVKVVVVKAVDVAVEAIQKDFQISGTLFHLEVVWQEK